MKQKIIPSAIYALTTVCLAEFFDAAYGAGPVTRYVRLTHLAIAGTVLFAIACISSLFTLRFGTVCALAASVLAWPYFANALTAIPWGSLVSVLPYANWRYELTAILLLAVSSVYSAAHAWQLFRVPVAGQV